MRVILVTSIYPPEPVVSAQTSASVARALTVNGDDVTVITAFPNRPAGVLYPGFKRRLFQRESSDDGYKIIRCFATLSPASSLISRFLENLSFGLSAGCALLFLPRPEVIYANTWPIVATGILVLIARLRRIPVVLSIQDVYPESLAAQGRMEAGSFWAKFLTSIDTWISRQAETIIVISERFAEIYRTKRQVSAERIRVIPNWVDEAMFTERNRGLDIRKAHSLNNQVFLVVYGGNIGVGADLEIAIEAMIFVPDERQVQLLIAGAGSQLSACQDLAAHLALQNISFHTPWPPGETAALLKAADVLLLPTLGRQSDVSVPSKMITYMLSGRPIIAIVNEDSEAADVIQQAGCGWILPPGRSKLLAVLIEEISNMPREELDELGESGRQYSLEHFSSSGNLPKVLAALYVGR